MKFVVVTEGDKQIVALGEDMWARHNRASVVRSCAFIEQHIGSKQLKILASVNDEASDTDLAEKWEKLLEDAEGDAEAAGLTYAKAYPLVAEKPVEKPKRGASATA